MNGLTEHLSRLNAHRAWANRLYVEWAVAQASSPSFRASSDGEYCLKMFSHVLRVEAVWLMRLAGGVPENRIWESVPHENMESLRAANDSGLESALLGDLSRVARYESFGGVAMETSVADILTHACTHGMYHRGQVASRAAQAGLPNVPGTDFIVFSRLFP